MANTTAAGQSSQQLNKALLTLEAIATTANITDGYTHRTLGTILGDGDRLEQEVMQLLTVIQQIGAMADGASELLGGHIVRGGAIDWFAPEVKAAAEATEQGATA
ncbi:MAG: hypothetical protein EPO09_19000 [Aquabacterium sp.]|uniref:hypothetical protein n=1 Tax=Aquabacterium sp. TaxID=1872578 RepID=UPI001208D970|nr:hypothetical protein [Aquabacterium sp.]TAK87082.1 MAG: hypothetical protein EPO09_19000 [Aquabacterium sp.]